MKYIFLSPWQVNKNSTLYQFQNEFLSRIEKFICCEIIAASKTLNEKEAIAFFEREIKKLNVQKPICFAFDERGVEFSSEKFAKELNLQEIQGEKLVVFCFGSAYGLPKELAPIVRLKLISLSQLTFSHELAYSVAFEQIYRARCIIENHPYHHGEKSSLIKELNK